jgi:hypothetical protein
MGLPGETSVEVDAEIQYFTDSTWGMSVWFIFTGGHWPRRSEKVMWDDLASFIFSSAENGILGFGLHPDNLSSPPTILGMSQLHPCV